MSSIVWTIDDFLLQHLDHKSAECVPLVVIGDFDTPLLTGGSVGDSITDACDGVAEGRGDVCTSDDDSDGSELSCSISSAGDGMERISVESI